jgi:hypothetical protein
LIGFNLVGAVYGYQNPERLVLLKIANNYSFSVNNGVRKPLMKRSQISCGYPPVTWPPVVLLQAGCV